MSGIVNQLKEWLGKKKNNEEKEEPPKNMKEVIDKLPVSFHEYIEQELPYRRASAVAFLLLVIVFGTPLWWMTTQTYRAPFNTFSANQSIPLHIRVNLAISDASLKGVAATLREDLLHKLNEADVVQPLKIHWSIRDDGVRSLNSLQTSEKESDNLEVNVALVPSGEWPYFSANYVQLGGKGRSFVQYTGEQEREKTLNRMYELVWEVLVDVPHLNSIVLRDLRIKMAPWQIASLPLSHQKRLVWDSSPLAMDYLVQIIFVHENGPTVDRQRHAMHVLNTMADKLKHVSRLKISSEHLWDLEVSTFLEKDVQERWTLTYRSMERLIQEVDMQLQTVESAFPLLKLVILETEMPVVILDQQDEDSRGAVIAAWGAVIPRSEETEARLLASMRVLLGIDSDLMSGWARDEVPLANWEIDRLTLRAVLDNSMRTRSAVGALKALTEKITNIVVEDEVANRATKAVELVTKGLEEKRPRLDLISTGRRLADEALSHPTLLSLLYFPQDQKVAVYLPIMLPTVLPVVGSLIAIVKWILGKH